MNTNYYVVPKFPSGAVGDTIIADYRALTYTSEVNNAGGASLTLRDNHPACSMLYTDKSQIEIWRENKSFGLSATKVWSGLARSDITQFDKTGNATFYFEDHMSVLKWRQILYYSGIQDISEFTNRRGETILKNLVYWNAGAGAIVGAPYNRFVAGVVPQVSVETDQLRGNLKSWSCQPSDNLLETLQKIVAAGAGGDFSLREVSGSQWTFEFWPGQLGADRTASVRFALGRGNMARPRRESDRRSERTVAIVGGDGKGQDLVWVVRYGTNYSLPVNNPSNHHEFFVTSGGFKSIPALEAVGDRALYEARARRKFSFQPLQTQGSFWGVHYFLGDLVTADIFGTTTTHKITKVSVSHVGSDTAEGGGDENVTVECSEV
jgi:hypothetical protein